MLRKQMDDLLVRLIHDYCRENNIQNLWKEPIIKYADAGDPGFEKLKTIVKPDHFLPGDFMAGPKTVLSYFLPFKEEVGNSNLHGYDASKEWANAYLTTNAMAAVLNLQLAEAVKAMGYDAAVPQNIGFLPSELMSRWSQRHVAYLAGHGTFGLNNLLISDVGSCGRYFSIVTSLPVGADPLPFEERCLFKRDGSCGICVERCVGDALTYDGFNRWKCFEVCQHNAQTYPGAQVCGKCAVGLPCSFAPIF